MRPLTEAQTIPELVADVIRAKAQLNRVQRDVEEADRVANRLRNAVYPEAQNAYWDAEHRLKEAIEVQARELSGGGAS